MLQLIRCPLGEGSPTRKQVLDGKCPAPPMDLATNSFVGAFTCIETDVVKGTIRGWAATPEGICRREDAPTDTTTERSTP